jgi:hypothetical protein
MLASAVAPWPTPVLIFAIDVLSNSTCVHEDANIYLLVALFQIEHMPQSTPVYLFLKSERIATPDFLLIESCSFTA